MACEKLEDLRRESHGRMGVKRLTDKFIERINIEDVGKFRSFTDYPLFMSLRNLVADLRIDFDVDVEKEQAEANNPMSERDPLRILAKSFYEEVIDKEMYIKIATKIYLMGERKKIKRRMFLIFYGELSDLFNRIVQTPSHIENAKEIFPQIIRKIRQYNVWLYNDFKNSFVGIENRRGIIQFRITKTCAARIVMELSDLKGEKNPIEMMKADQLYDFIPVDNQFVTIEEGLKDYFN